MIDPDDQAYRHYSAKSLVQAWISEHLFASITYTVRHGLLVGMKRKGGLGWMPALIAGGETDEYRFWKNLPLVGQTIYDVGAFEGLLTMFFASRSRQVVCYEPNSKNRARLEENLRLNGLSNVVVRPVGVGSHPQSSTQVFSSLTPGGASLDEKIAISSYQKHDVRSEQIEIVTLDQDIAENCLPAPDLIKIDIEGWELEALRGARQTLIHHRPVLFLEMHGETMNEKRRKVAEIVAFLNEIGYHKIHHIETGTIISAANSNVAARGHLYCPAPQ